jgi:hypothetical protein
MHDACIGKSSLKYIRKERRALIDQIRVDLSNEQRLKGHTGVVTEKSILRELHHIILQKYFDKRNAQTKLDTFYLFKGIFERARINAKNSFKMMFKKIAGRCFYAWSNWIYMVGVGLDRRRWTGPRKYEVCIFLLIELNIVFICICF